MDRMDGDPTAWQNWLVPDWPAAPRVRALCTTRQGGVSAPPRDSLNLGAGVGDGPQAVAQNWDIVRRAMAAHSRGQAVRPLRMHQVHGVRLLDAVGAATPDGLCADASSTTEAAVACVALAADCLPVLFTDRAGTRVAAAHAGWRGLVAGVLEAALAPFRAAAGQGPLDVLAWLGPCIGPSAFEVGPEVRDAFCARAPEARACFRAAPGGKFLADLAGLARQRLHAQGVQAVHGNDGSAPWCTVGNPGRFFSHRRDTPAFGSTGRMAACVWLVP